MPAVRPVNDVPRGLWWALLVCVALQIAWHAALPRPQGRLHSLPSPPTSGLARALSFGDPMASAKLGMLWLQAFDTQAGSRIPLRSLNYAEVGAWLTLFLALDPRAQYPLLAASRLYAEVADDARSRQMLELVATEFARDPARRWPWLAHAVYIARHKLKDRALALRYAEQLASAKAPNIPHWAKQLNIFVLEDMGEIEAAKILLGGLLASGQISDLHEQQFLTQRLGELENKAKRGIW